MPESEQLHKVLHDHVLKNKNPDSAEKTNQTKPSNGGKEGLHLNATFTKVHKSIEMFPRKIFLQPFYEDQEGFCKCRLEYIWPPVKRWT